MAYRLVPHSTTGISPSQLLQGCKPQSKIDLLIPNTAKRVEDKELHHKTAHDVSAHYCKFEVGDLVYVVNVRGRKKGILGEIIQLNGSVSVQLQNGKTVRRSLSRQRTERSEQAISALETVAENVDDTHSEIHRWKHQLRSW